MKKFLGILFLIIYLTFTPPIFAGNDITITCNSTQCLQNPVLPLFSETNIYPGFVATQKVVVNNNRNASCFLNLKGVSEIPGILADQISLDIIGVGNTFSLTNYPLTSLLNSSVNLGEISQNSQTVYNWSATLNRDADNNYADKSTTFAIDFNFTCDDEPSLLTTSEGQVAGASTFSPPQCTNSYPSAPTGLSAITGADGTVTLNWNHTISDHTGYLIAFGTSPGNYLYGAPDVGNINQYTVESLTPGAQYCFYVRSLNGCMPGERTPEYCINPGSNIIATNIVPTGFQPGVLGATTDEDQLTPTPTGEILGESNTVCNHYWLPILFLVALLINLILTRFFSIHWFITFLVSLIAFLVDFFLHQNNCCLSPNWLCSYFWVGSLVSFIFPSLFRHQNN